MANCLLAWKMDFLRMGFGRKFFNFRYSYYKFYSTQTKSNKKGLLLGLYSEKPEQYTLTKSGAHYNSSVSGKLTALLDRLDLNIEKGATRVFYDVSPDYLAVCVVGLGKSEPEQDELEEIDEKKERVRIAAGVGTSTLQTIGVKEIDMESFGDAESAAEGATLKLWQYDELKNKEKRKEAPRIKLYPESEMEDKSPWNVGIIKGDAQNLARRLTDAPANLMTPSIFAENALELFKEIPSVEVLARDKTWAKQQGMNSFLSVSKGSNEPPVFLEINYRGRSSSDPPVVLVGKGVTFDSGGINIKPTSGLTDMRGDKGGAACIVAATHAAAQLNLPLNITALIPLCENMVGGSANKTGDVVIAMNGKTVRIDNTDAEGRLILADALWYAKKFNPRFIMDLATLTGAVSVALGGEASAVFTNSNFLWSNMHAAGKYTGDRVWRLPLWKGYAKGITDTPSVDVCNIRKSGGGGACSAAAFLREFVPPGDWLHLDIAGVMGPNEEKPYLGKGMTGRPTRTLIQFLCALR